MTDTDKQENTQAHTKCRIYVHTRYARSTVGEGESGDVAKVTSSAGDWIRGSGFQTRGKRQSAGRRHKRQRWTHACEQAAAAARGPCAHCLNGRTPELARGNALFKEESASTANTARSFMLCFLAKKPQPPSISAATDVNTHFAFLFFFSHRNDASQARQASGRERRERSWVTPPEKDEAGLARVTSARASRRKVRAERAGRKRLRIQAGRQGSQRSESWECRTLSRRAGYRSASRTHRHNSAVRATQHDATAQTIERHGARTRLSKSLPGDVRASQIMMLACLRSIQRLQFAQEACIPSYLEVLRWMHNGYERRSTNILTRIKGSKIKFSLWPIGLMRLTF